MPREPATKPGAEAASAPPRPPQATPATDTAPAPPESRTVPQESATAPGPSGGRSPGADGPVRAILAGRVALVTAVAVGVGMFLNWYGNRHDFFDLKIYVAAMRWWADGNDLYDYAQPDRVQGALYFTYPPFAALLLRPFAEIPFGLTVWIFTVGTVVAIAVTTWWLVRPLADARGWPRWFAAGLAVPLVFLIEPTRETIAFGQINMLLIVLVMVDLLIAHPRGWRLAGAGIGLATALKLFPGIFIVYLVVTRRWRAAVTASAAAAGATLLAAAVAPQASWQFWTEALWSTERVGRTDYTGNQSLQGMLARLSAPELPNRLVWLVLVVAVTVFGLWCAARAARAGDEVTGMALTGLVAALVSPITWPHHVYWFVPAVVVLVSAASMPRGGGSAATGGAATGGAATEGAATEGAATGSAGGGRRVIARRVTGLALAGVVYAVTVFGVVSFIDFGVAAEPTDTVAEFLLRNAYVLAAGTLLALLPVYTRSPRE